MRRLCFLLLFSYLVQINANVVILPISTSQSPPNYNTFTIPPIHGTYRDPIFGSAIQRLTDARATLNTDRGGLLEWITDEYSTMSPFNSDNSRIILVHQSYFGLYDGTGVYTMDLPLEINSSSEPRWSRQNNHTIYYVHGNQFKSFDITTSATIVVRTFNEYTSISGMGESDISLDGDHFVFAGDHRFVFVYQISSDTKSQTLDTNGHGFDSIYITPKNNVTISWFQSGTNRYQGIELFDSHLAFQRQVTHAGGHMDTTLDLNGDEVLVWTNSNDPQPIANCNNGIVKIRLADATQTCLLQLDWSLAVHISAPDIGYIFVETYAPSNPDATNWKLYTNELLQIRLDGSQVVRLAHHRSRPFPGNTYNWQPKMSASRDGTRVVYNSNYDTQTIFGYPANYSDVYMIVLGKITPVTPITPITPKTKRYEEDSSSVHLTGIWFTNTNKAESGGTAALSSERGSKIVFNFSGTGVKWLGLVDTWAGTANVYLDGIYMSNIDTYAPNEKYQATVYSLSGLSNTIHELKIVVTGLNNGFSQQAWVWVDAFDVVQ
jgi:hypothetical protein